MNDYNSEGLRNDAIAIVKSSIQRLLEDDTDRNLIWLPDDFAETIAALAWDHQFDIDGTLFRRKLNGYLTDISKDSK